MNELLKVNYGADRITVSARELHEFLEVSTRYNDWIKRMCEYGFIENIDYQAITQKRVTAQGNGVICSDLEITLDMAKEISMIQRTKKGKQARQYFIELEKKWNSPEFIMNRALEYSKQRCNALMLENNQLKVEKEIMRPKAEYFDELIDRKLNTGIRETAKELKIKEKRFVSFLLEHKYLYRDKFGKLTPFARYFDELFEVKETYNKKTQWTGTQTLITPKGRETFRLLCSGI